MAYSGTKWPEAETVSDATQGVQLATMQKLAHYWATDYDWRKVEARLNALPQFVTTIDGLDIHFISNPCPDRAVAVQPDFRVAPELVFCRRSRREDRLKSGPFPSPCFGGHDLVYGNPKLAPLRQYRRFRALLETLRLKLKE